jgi:hypothetical protein
MNIKKRVHSGWQMYKNDLNTLVDNIFGKYQYICSSERGTISLIELPNYHGDGQTIWEIYSDNTLFDDVIKFKTKREALREVRKYLE